MTTPFRMPIKFVGDFTPCFERNVSMILGTSKQLCIPFVDKRAICHRNHRLHMCGVKILACIFCIGCIVIINRTSWTLQRNCGTFLWFAFFVPIRARGWFVVPI
eukprot:Lithocolla_globosa_v1_NODE_1900_length_2268_cov_4.343425.p2 type:complete len:104 gc:universal NODE_1900_length_2268_cov_4.343425:1541-1852(+)